MCTLVSALVIGMPEYLVHYSIVWATTGGVDVVAHNGPRLSLSLGTGERRRFTPL
jgi:hypothetical protein